MPPSGRARVMGITTSTCVPLAPPVTPIVPESSLSTSVRTIWSPKLESRSSTNPEGSPTPSSDTRSRSSSGRLAISTVTETVRDSVPNACSNAFWISSAMISARGVAIFAGKIAGAAVDPDPDRALRCGESLLDHLDDTTRNMIEVDAFVRVLRQRLVNQCDGGDPADALLQRLLRLHRAEPAALEAQQRCDGLEVVLHAMVDLADRRVLEEEHPVAVPQFGDVSQDPDGSGHLPRVDDRDEAPIDPRARGVDLVLDGSAPLQRFERRFFVELEFGDVLADQVRRYPEPPVRRHGVRARVDDDPTGVEPHEAVAHSRGDLTLVGRGERKGSFRRHLLEIAGGLQIRELQL